MRLSANTRVGLLRAVSATFAVLAIGVPSAAAYSQGSVGTSEQVAWVRRAAGNFLTAELAGNGSAACGILAAHLRGDFHGRTCAERWDAKLSAMLHERGERSRLRRELHAAVSARVTVHGHIASIQLPAPLIDPANRFVWSENCWMLQS